MRFSRFVRTPVIALGAAGLLGLFGGCGEDATKAVAPPSDAAQDAKRTEDQRDARQKAYGPTGIPPEAQKGGGAGSPTSKQRTSKG
jgi:hypothetical protein